MLVKIVKYSLKITHVTHKKTEPTRKFTSRVTTYYIPVPKC